MKYSKLWLQELTNLSISTEKLTEQLTMAGLEVSTIEPVAPKFHGVVIGEILEVTQHLNADKLTICRVNVGAKETLNIVCGAPNVKPNLKVPVALIGAELPNNFKIKTAKLRGIDSSGMLCSAVELGLSTNAFGILELPNTAPIGTDIREYLLLDDEILEIDLTANRGDCLSMLGIAREIATINRTKLPQLTVKQQEQSKDTFPVKILAEDSCPHYVSRIIRGINNKVSTPNWMQERLRRLGLNLINFIVDVTNYTMLELGQPLHAFDLATIDKHVEVRYANAGENIDLLNGRKIELNNNILVIADNHKPLAIGGVMGGDNTKVSIATTDIFLESAFFIPEKIALTSRFYNLSTDASYRYERGVDYTLQMQALERATSLIIAIAGGKPGTVSEITSQKYLPKFSNIILRWHSVKNIIGITIPDKDIEDILIHLGITIGSITDGWQVTIPSFRFDLKIEEDLIEEIARVYGYHLIPEQKIVTSLHNPRVENIDLSYKKRLFTLMGDLGYHEVITYSFVDEKFQKILNRDVASLPLANPLSNEQSVMRTTLWPGLLNAVKHNIERQKQRVRLFEIGLKFLQHNDKLEQIPAIAGVTYGNLYPEQWGIKQNEQADFFDMKNDVMRILDIFVHKNIEYLPKKHITLHPKRSAEICVDGETIGLIGELHPTIKQYLKIDKNICLFEINLYNIIKKLKYTFKVFSKFPCIQRDIAIIVDKKIQWIEIKKKIVDISAELLQDVILFDIYCSKNIGLDKRSMAIRMVFQSVNRTLIDSEVDLLINQIVLVLKQTFGASLRG
ncbi:MAG: phenylalanine--tRNA ligase subunit beta [Coxiellaceae bacterium]|jgi:phenylalanyl-tRNA synthetase beta chain|nr:phenylalanine--tRNA ligase subunit beta [Coxiellaceae bacterium]